MDTLKFNDFRQKTFRQTQPQSLSDTDTIYEVACTLLEKVDLSIRPLRLIGLSVSDFSKSSQMVLFEAPRDDKRKQLQELSDSIARRFGDSGITRASLLSRAAEKTLPDKDG